MMKAAIIFTLLLTTVLCRPAKRSLSSSESSEEQFRAARGNRYRALALPQETAAQKARVSEVSSETSEEAVGDIVAAVKSAITDIFSETTSLPDPSPSPDTTADPIQDDDEDDYDEDDSDNSEDSEENDTDEDKSSDSSDDSSDKLSTPSPVTLTTVMEVVTEEPTAEPITPTIVIDQGRGDSVARYPSDYKTILYLEDKSYQKVPLPYKSYEIMNGGKKMAYDMTDGNEVEKGLKVYKALQVHADLLEEDTSTPEVENQGLDTSFGASSPDQEASAKQALLPDLQDQEVSFSPGNGAPSESSSATEEEEEEESPTSASNSASPSQESEDSEDATGTPGAADSQSDESDGLEDDSEEEGVVILNFTTDVPVVVTAK